MLVLIITTDITALFPCSYSEPQKHASSFRVLYHSNSDAFTLENNSSQNVCLFKPSNS